MTIISSKPDQVAKAIDEQVGRGLTILMVEAIIVVKKRRIICCCCKTQVSRAKKIIRKIDNQAF